VSVGHHIKLVLLGGGMVPGGDGDRDAELISIRRVCSEAACATKPAAVHVRKSWNLAARMRMHTRMTCGGVLTSNASILTLESHRCPPSGRPRCHLKAGPQ